jgi:hypothetical protein
MLREPFEVLLTAVRHPGAPRIEPIQLMHSFEMLQPRLRDTSARQREIPGLRRRRPLTKYPCGNTAPGVDGPRLLADGQTAARPLFEKGLPMPVVRGARSGGASEESRFTVQPPVECKPRIPYRFARAFSSGARVSPDTTIGARSRSASVGSSDSSREGRPSPQGSLGRGLGATISADGHGPQASQCPTGPTLAVAISAQEPADRPTGREARPPPDWRIPRSRRPSETQFPGLCQEAWERRTASTALQAISVRLSGN